MNSDHQEIARCLFRESNDALFIFDTKEHRVLDVNPAGLRLTGLEKEAACGLRLHDLFISAEPGRLDRLIDAYRRTGFFHSREGYHLVCRPGEPIPVNLSVSRIHTQPEPLGLVVARDITERVRAQEALRESEARFRGVVETAELIIWATSTEGRIESLNPAFTAVTGWPCRVWIGRHFADLLHPDDVPVGHEAFDRAMQGESLPPFELRVRSAAGKDVVLEVLSAARQTHAGRSIVSGIARDVTGRRQAEEATRHAEAMRNAKEAAEAASRAKGKFLGHISHEIRTPMTAVLGFTDLLLEDERVRALPADLLDALRTIRQSGSHLLNLIDDILDLTKIEAGRLRIERRPCDPGRLASEVAASLRSSAEGKGLTLSVDPPPEGPVTILCDSGRLRQILINLLNNAIKFTREGGVRLRIRVHREAGVAPTLRFSVIDTGIGMSSDEVGKLFEPFYTSTASTTRESGAGLGLSISRRLAEMLGGGITVRSRVGRGSVFTLTLPLEVPDAAAPAAPGPEAPCESEPAVPPVPVLQGSRILLAEDNETIRRFLALRLGQYGAEVAVACNGREAVEQALAARQAGRPFDWILMDVQMPIMDGYEATRELRSHNYRGWIIALTAYATDEDRHECLRFGCDDHLSKPVDWARLIETLESHRGAIREAEATRP